jgi:hypothetical protein
MPAGTGAFDFYAEPNDFGVFNVTATANDGTTLTLPVNGFGGATGFGVFASAGQTIASITVTSTDSTFAVGEFGIAREIPAPEPSTFALFGTVIGLGLGGWVWRRRRTAVPVAA